jgi:hypothetical protein
MANRKAEFAIYYSNEIIYSIILSSSRKIHRIRIKLYVIY